MPAEQKMTRKMLLFAFLPRKECMTTDIVVASGMPSGIELLGGQITDVRHSRNHRTAG
jgi:hypothetical protein